MSVANPKCTKKNQIFEMLFGLRGKKADGTHFFFVDCLGQIVILWRYNIYATEPATLSSVGRAVWLRYLRVFGAIYIYIPAQTVVLGIWFLFFFLHDRLTAGTPRGRYALRCHRRYGQFLCCRFGICALGIARVATILIACYVCFWLFGTQEVRPLDGCSNFWQSW